MKRPNQAGLPSRKSVPRRRFTRGAIVLSLCLLGCGDDCVREAGFAEGTRFEVTVIEDSLGCYTTFSAGETFYVLAGKPYEQEGCPVSTGKGVPMFAQTELEFGECQSSMNLGVACDVTFPGCSEPGSTLDTWFYDTPKERGATVSTKFFMSLQSACGGGCGPSIPVRIKWL